MDGKDQAADAVARACRVIGRLGFSYGAVGHVSQRLPGEDVMAIRGKSDAESGLASTRATDVVVADFDGRPVDSGPGLRVPSECFIHCAIYQANPEVNAVVHAHLRSAVIAAALDHPLTPVYAGYEILGARMAADGVPVFENPAMVDDPAIGDEFAKLLGTAPAALMRGHGATVVGRSLEEAMVRLASLEELCAMTVEFARLGIRSNVTADDVLAMTSKLGGGRARGVASEEALVSGVWRGLLARAGESE